LSAEDTSGTDVTDQTGLCKDFRHE
jgi:hypothetical protein